MEHEKIINIFRISCSTYKPFFDASFTFMRANLSLGIGLLPRFPWLISYCSYVIFLYDIPNTL